MFNRMTLKAIATLILMPFGANLLTVAASFVIIPLALSPEDRSSFQHIARIFDSWVVGSLAVIFAVISGMCAVYTMPIFKAIRGKCASPEERTKAQRRLLNAPLIISVFGSLGWACGILEFSLFFLHPDLHSTPAGHVRRILSAAILSGSVFVIGYYSIEALSRKHLIPVIFPKGQLGDVPGAIHLSIRSRLFIYFFAVIFFPVLFSYCAMLAGTLDLLQVGVALGAHVISVAWLTLLVAGSYQQPLQRMTRAAGQIRSARYDIDLPITSNDEIGQLGETMIDMAQGLREKEFIKDTFGKVVDPKVRDILLSEGLGLGGELRRATILFTDIRGFTSLSEQLPPDRIVQLLNRYFEKMSECIASEKGMVNKYIGDAILAVFGVPLQQSDHAEAAIRAALGMRLACRALNLEFARDGFPAIRIGIGIHTGDVVAGNIGTRDRVEYTVIGDTVNVASRIEGLCKDFQQDLLISEQTMVAAHYGNRVSRVASVQVKGRLEPVNIYTIAPEPGIRHGTAF